MNSAIILGCTRQLWSLKAGTIWGSQVQPDTQLAFLGVINKILDYLVTNVIEHIALLVITLRMTRVSSESGPAGVHPIDFEMKEQLLKPWIAISSFIERCHLLGWPCLNHRSGASLSRFCVTMVVSICFLLQAAAMNTVGLPKARWYPDLWPKSKANDALMTLKTPRMNLTSIDWTDYQYTGLNNVRSGHPGSTVALASASTYVMLNLLDNIYSKPPGWLYANEKSAYATAIYTNTSDSKVQSISIQGSAVIDIYNHMKETGPMYAKLSAGMIGTINLTAPMLTTRCDPGPLANLSTGTTLAQVSEPSASNPYLDFQIASDAALNFTGAHCVLSLQ